MKKILFSVLTCALALTSCDMDLAPVGSLDNGNAVETVKDCLQFRNGMYMNLRSMGTWIGTQSIQGDEFYGIIINGNVYSGVSSGNILSNDGDLSGAWSSSYSVIADANYFINHAEKLLDKEDISAVDKQSIARFIGEAKFVRAYAYYVLTDRYCNAYTNVDPTSTVTGVPIKTVYEPSGNQATYPGRSSLEDVYTYIETDLKDAYDALAEWESLPDTPDPNTGLVEEHKQYLVAEAPILNTWVVKAMQCRLALLKGEYATAKTLANEIIESGIYLMTERADVEKLWKNDTSREIIFMPYANNTSELAAALGTTWNDVDPTSSYFIPTASVVNDLYTSRDIRRSVFLSTRELLVDGSSVTTPIFNKYPGNPNLNEVADNNEIRNKSKMFRLSEIYLILAEACYETQDEAGANAALSAIRSRRILLYSSSAVDYSGTELRDQIRLERQRELIGEGFRISDLRRWGLGFDRTNVSYTNAEVAPIVVVASRITYTPGDYRYVWPIPASEIEVNPQLRGQQNPGYGN